MKIQSLNPTSLLVSNKNKTVVINPAKDFSTAVDIALCPAPNTDFPAGKSTKVITLPGEFEISDILLKGFFSCNHQENIIYKINIEGVSVLYFGNLSSKHDFDINKFNFSADILLLTILH